MSQFKFQVQEMRDSTPQEWLCKWAARYQSDDDAEYWRLIGKYPQFSADDFRDIGKWKDGATTEKQWRANVASVAYVVWQQAAEELPKCPDENGVESFLDDWSDRKYEDVYESGFKRTKTFGPPRATTLLHFISGARYPIFDSRVRKALSRLLGKPQLENTVKSYLDSYVHVFKELAGLCGTTDYRELDKALFSYGGLDKNAFSS